MFSRICFGTSREESLRDVERSHSVPSEEYRVIVLLLMGLSGAAVPGCKDQKLAKLIKQVDKERRPIRSRSPPNQS